MIIENGDADEFEKHNVQLEDYLGDDAEEADFLRVESEIGHLQEFYMEEGTFMYYVVSGEGTFYLDGEPKEVEEKDLVVAPPETKIYYLGRMELILICTPPYDPENEVHVRYLDENGKTISKEERERRYDRNEVEVSETGFETVNKTHKQIPEFDESHLEEKYERKCSGNDPVHLVAKKGHKLVGYAVCYDKFGDGSYYVWMAGVRPEKRREGVMTQIIEKASEIAGEKEYSSIKIKTRNERKEMRHFLTEKGFEVCGYNEKETADKSEILHKKSV